MSENGWICLNESQHLAKIERTPSGALRGPQFCSPRARRKQNLVFRALTMTGLRYLFRLEALLSSAGALCSRFLHRPTMFGRVRWVG